MKPSSVPDRWIGIDKTSEFTEPQPKTSSRRASVATHSLVLPASITRSFWKDRLKSHNGERRVRREIRSE